MFESLVHDWFSDYDSSYNDRGLPIPDSPISLTAFLP